jgi:hypothetical protein
VLQQATTTTKENDMTISAKAILLSFHSFSHDGNTPTVRPIDMDNVDQLEADAMFNEAYNRGQNIFQALEMCSVSAGDLIEIDFDGSKEWRSVEGVGFSAPMGRIGAIKFYRKALQERAIHQGIATDEIGNNIANAKAIIHW